MTRDDFRRWRREDGFLWLYGLGIAGALLLFAFLVPFLRRVGIL